ncbi:MAG: hypothetical protein C0494_10580 [Sphingobium sp.]|nr:hypothetical protein [Sphingobium sp.]
MTKFGSSQRSRLLTAVVLPTLFYSTLAHSQTAPVKTAPATAKPVTPSAGTIRSFAGPFTGTAGTIRSFEGDVEPDAGTIRSFAGTIRSFAGTIRSFEDKVYVANGIDPLFWGSLSPSGGALSPDAGTIRSFAGQFEALAGTIRSFADAKSASSDPALYANAGQDFSALIAASKSNWGAAVEQRSGKTFEKAFVEPLLAKYGIDLASPGSLKGLNPATTELFLLDWYDNLMNYSGIDMVDHWMKAVNWSPSLTQQVLTPRPAKIGLLDFTVNGLEAGNVIEAKGVSTVDAGHGTAVASLIVGAHDNRGVMGLAPTAQVIAFNPFDSTMTAGWGDIATGLRLFADRGVSVVNMSLGVPGWTLSDGWNTVFTEDKLNKAAKEQLFVLAAGNDGVVQPGNILWSDKNPAFIVVGSVDPNGNISSFSNTPGSTCLLKDAKAICDAKSDKLMNHFMVAPGEFMLVSDGAGGVTRMSGTSFAAPLVSGTATLIADRWPWLSKRPGDIADIILNTAKDLGAPGVDAVYGHGMLDVTAALSPPSFDKLNWKVSINGTVVTYSGTKIAQAAVANRAVWEAAGAYVTVFSDTATSYRDFIIPLSSKLFGQSTGVNGEAFQSYLSSRFWAWAQGALPGKPGYVGFTESLPSVDFANSAGLQLSLSMTPRAHVAGLRPNRSMFDSAMTLGFSDGKGQLQFGSGGAASSLSQQLGFGMKSDYDVFTGGANPILGLASGKNFATLRYSVGRRLHVAAGVTSRDDRRARTGLQFANPDLDRYKSRASTVSVTYDAAKWLSASATYTLLDERDALLGMQSIDPSDLSGGSRTDAATLGIEMRPLGGLSIAASATMGRTRQSDASQQNLAVGAGGLRTSAFQVAITQAGLFSGNDSMRISLAQPMHIESGTLDFSSVSVVDRQTGELGVVTQHISMAGSQRNHIVESIYRREFMDGGIGVSMFGRARLGAGDGENREAALLIGSSVGFRF